MPFDASPYHLENRDTHEKVTKINAFMDAVENMANGFLSANEIASTEIDWSAGDWHEDTITGNKIYTFANVNSTYTNSISLLLTIDGAFEPTFPAAVKWSFGVEPVWTDGVSYLITFTYVPSAAKYLAGWLEYDLS